MTGTIRKILMGAAAAAILGASLVVNTAPSAAQGWQSAAWRGGGWRGGYWGPGGWHGGWGWHRGWGWGWGGAVAAGVASGLALGALAGAAASYPYYGYYGYYGGCYWQNRPVYDSWGNFAGYAPVDVCY